MAESVKRVHLRAVGLERYRVQHGDVLLSCRGTLLKAAQVDRNVAGWIASNNLVVVRPGQRLHPAIVVALAKGTAWQRRMQRNVQSSTGLQQVTLKDIGDLPVPLMSFEQQAELVKLIESEHRHHRLALQAAAKRRQLVHDLLDEVFGLQEE